MELLQSGNANSYSHLDLPVACVGAFVGKKSAPDSSSATHASISLGTSPVPDGLYQAHTEGDGETVEARVGGKDCQQLVAKPGRIDAYLYLQAGSAFKNKLLPSVKVTVEYFDTTPTSFYVHYNGTEEGRDGAYKWSRETVETKGLSEWQTAEIVLHNPHFTGRQNGNADFRIVVKDAPRTKFYVRSVTLSED